MKKLSNLMLAAAAMFPYALQAQVSAYTFTQTTGTYVPITGTDLFGANWNDHVAAAIPLGFNFQFNAVSYSSVTVSSNGFVTFGFSSPTIFNYLPISSTGTYSGSISAFGRDLGISTPTTTGISYTVTGSSPNRKFIVQWENAQRNSVSGDAINFQIILNETSNKVDVIYGPCTATSTSNLFKVQVGLRGATNTDYNNRFGAIATSWNATSTGTVNTDNVNYKATVLPASGLTFSWLAPSCFPVSGLASTGTSTSTATFTWASTSGTNFDVYYGPTPLTAPGATTAPTATTSATAFTVTGLSPATAYALYVRNNCGAGNVSAWSPAVSFATPCAPPPVSTTGNARCGVGTMTLGATTTAGSILRWYAASTGGSAISTGSVFTTPTISTTTNYYVSSTSGMSTFTAGIGSASGSSSYIPTGEGLRFNATLPFTINSVDVYSNDAASGIITVELQSSSGTVLNSYTMTIPPGAGTTPVTVPLNFAIAPGSGYYLVATDGPNIIYNSSSVSYPYAIGSVGSITSGYDGSGGNSTSEYFYFFNWQVSTFCESPRSMVTATVTTPLPLSVNASATVCSNAISTVSVTSTASNYDSYIWSPVSNLYTNAAATIPYTGGSATLVYYKSATANSTTYTLTATNSVSGCSNTKTLSVTAQNVPAITVTSSPTTALCTAGASATLIATGTSTSYTWNTGATTASIVVTPATTTSYTITGVNSCGTHTTSTTVSVAVTPTISATTTQTIICANKSVVLKANATPGVTFLWNTGPGTATISVSPSVTTTYTVTGTNACGIAKATVTQSVSPCVGIDEITGAGEISIYPNPANDYVSIAVPASIGSANASVEITDALGKIVLKEIITAGITTLRIAQLEDGVYFFKVISNNQSVKVGKVVKH